jgi:hypothetical protein
MVLTVSCLMANVNRKMLELVEVRSKVVNFLFEK